MKQLLIICALLSGLLSGFAQSEIDNFNVGPYTVDYNGQGDVKYRLRDNINLYEFFDLQRDTTVITLANEIPLKHAIEIGGYIGANRYASKEIYLNGVWKQLVAKNLYFNGGLSIGFDLTKSGKVTRNMFEFGIPLQIELGKLNHQYASLYGMFGITPTFYTTMKAEGENAPLVISKDKSGHIDEPEVSPKKTNAADNITAPETPIDTDDVPHKANLKKSGFLIAPMLELGGNIPVKGTILRIGVYAKYKINCTTGDFDVYKETAGRMFLGAKIGVIF